VSGEVKTRVLAKAEIVPYADAYYYKMQRGMQGEGRWQTWWTLEWISSRHNVYSAAVDAGGHRRYEMGAGMERQIYRHHRTVGLHTGVYSVAIINSHDGS
jgi:hypothetical protein